MDNKKRACFIITPIGEDSSDIRNVGYISIEQDSGYNGYRKIEQIY